MTFLRHGGGGDFVNNLHKISSEFCVPTDRVIHKNVGKRFLGHSVT